MIQAIHTAIDLVGLTAFAISGALLACRRRLDLVGVVVLAIATSIGGGIIRDVLMGDLPPVALTNSWWLAVPLLVAAVTFRFHPQIRRMNHTVEVFDAIGLGAFCATATAKAAAAGLPPMTAILLGTITGVGGGVLRDVLAGVAPAVLSPGALYAIPAVVGCTLVAVADQLGVAAGAVQIAAAAAISGLRLLALWRGWRAPVVRI